MTPEEMWPEPVAWISEAGERVPVYDRTTLEAYAAEKVAEERALADRQLYTRDKFIVDQGLWDAFLSTLPAANQHHGGNDGHG